MSSIDSENVYVAPDLYPDPDSELERPDVSSDVFHELDRPAQYEK